MIQIGAEVAEQGSIIERVEVNANAATDNIVAGTQQLTSAARHQVNCIQNIDFPHLFFSVF